MLRGGDFTSHMDSHDDREASPMIVALSGASSSASKPRKSKARASNQSSIRETLLRIFTMAKPEHSLLLLSAVTLAFNSLVQLTTPFFSGHIIDIALKAQQQGQDNKDDTTNLVKTLLVPLLALFGVVAFAAYLTFWRTLWQTRAGQRMAARLRRSTYAAILVQEKHFFDTSPDNPTTADLLVRLTSDVDLVQAAVQNSVLGALRSTTMSVGAAAMLLWTSWSLAFVALAILPPTMLMTKSVGRKMRDQHANVRARQAEAAGQAEQALTGIVTVQQFCAQAYEAEQYNCRVQKAHFDAIRTAKLQAAFSSIVQVLGNGSMLCVLGYGGIQVANGSLSAGALAGFVMYSLIMAGNVSSLSNIYVELTKSVAAANRLFAIMDRTPAIVPAPKLTVDAANETLDSRKYQPPSSSYTDMKHLSTFANSPTKPMAVDFRQIGFFYPTRPDVPVLQDVSLSIGRGEVLALVGASGSGKSTIASLLTRLYDPTQGAIYLDGANVQQMEPHQVRKNVGIVMQEPMLFPTSIMDNIRYGRLDATDEEVREAARLANVLDFCEPAFPEGLHTVVGARGTLLSGGQKQRVAVARVLLKNPPVVVFDEATSALDAQSEHQVQVAIDTAMKGRTVISIAHRLSTIKNADRIAVLSSGGRVAEVGTIDELVAQPNSAFRTLMKRQLLSE